MDRRLLIPTGLVLAAAGALAWVGLSADEPTYAPPAAVAAPDVVPGSLTGAVPAGHVVRTFEVEGICCSGCGGKLYGSLAAVEGVAEAALDVERAEAHALVPATLDTAELERALTFDKYTARLR